MQKVVGSSPIIRFTKAPLSGVFVSWTGTKHGFCKRNCKRTLVLHIETHQTQQIGQTQRLVRQPFSDRLTFRDGREEAQAKGR